jgi:pimeloyl-ACP methyl ester carboxylesterase
VPHRLSTAVTDGALAAQGGDVQFAAANGLQLCWQSFGDETAPALVLIMGLGAQMIVWDDLYCTGLAERGYRVIRFDNRDIGKSTKLDHLGIPNPMAMLGSMAIGRKIKAPYLLRDMAADTVGLLDALGIERAHIVGASMGGSIAQDIAIHFPNRIRSLISIMSTTGDPSLPAPSAQAAAILFTPTPTRRDAYISHNVKVQRVLRGPHFVEDEALDVARAERNFDRGIHPQGVARQLAAIFASGNRTAALAAVAVPTLVIHGDADPLIRVDGGKATARAIAGARLEIIPGMGHSLPRQVWPRLYDHISEIAR